MQTLGDGEGQGGLVCCSPWGHKELVSNQPKGISLIVLCIDFNFKIQEELYLGSCMTRVQDILLIENVCLNNLKTHTNDLVLESCSTCRTGGRCY